MTFCFVSDKQIKELNLLYLGKSEPTDVLAFDESDKEKDRLLADIAISCDTAARNARIYQTSVLYELCLYAVHGILHLSGYDDKTPTQRIRMQNKAEKILENACIHKLTI